MLCLGVTIERKELSLRSIQVHFKIWRPKKKKQKGGKNQSLAEGVWRWTCRSVGHAMPNEKLKAAYTRRSLRPHTRVA
jgi:hypothetical protein